MNKRKISLLRIALLLLIVAAVAAFVFFVVLPSRRAWTYARTLSDAMTNARSVSIVEFERGWVGRELVFQRMPATPTQIASLRSATGAWLAPIPSWQTMCFEPHHRIEIVRADGSELRFEVCFHCNNFELGSRQSITLPSSWRGRLNKFFTDAGMPPRDDYSELAKKHPEYHLLQGEIRAFEAQPFTPLEQYLKQAELPK